MINRHKAIFFSSCCWCLKYFINNILTPAVLEFPACSSLVLDEVEKQSTCELEVDAVAVDILNRLEIESKLCQVNILTC